MIMRSPLQIQNLPTRKCEEWKYTNLKRGISDGLLKAVPEEPNEILIHIKRGLICEQVESILWTGSDGLLHNPRLKVVLEEGACLTLVERHCGAGHYWKNMASEIVIGANAHLNHVRIQEDSAHGVLTDMTHISMDRDASYNAFTINLGGKLMRHDIHAVLNGVNSTCTLNGVSLLGRDQHGDTTILMEHIAPHCSSNQFYRSLLDGDSRCVFQGKVHVHKSAQKTDGYQLSNAILLSPNAEMDTKPELEIYADDVKCSHGATTGQLDEVPLFYLRSRGLNDKEARMLLIQAFVDEVVDKVVDGDIRTQIKEKARLWLKGAL